MKRNSFSIISLGCAKNTVDSQSMVQILDETGLTYQENPRNAEVIIVNTCGFIGDARDESYQVLADLSDKKKSGQILIAAGCLTQRYQQDVITQFPAVDGLLGTRRWNDIAMLVKQIKDRKTPEPVYHIPTENKSTMDVPGILRIADEGASAYIKIADGCRRPCAFCAIPLIKGTTVSRPIDAVIHDVEIMQQEGKQEIILIAQDTTDYGVDLGLTDGLSQLLDKMTERVPEIPWIRLMYAYPGYVTDRLIDVMATHPQILHYLDIPLQHGHPDTLKRMNRPHHVDWVYRTIEKMRKAIPDLAIRTTFIVGYPGETETEFEALLQMMRDLQFDRAGAFKFSFEPGTASEPLGDPVPAQIKAERYERLMLLQSEISQQKNTRLIGQTMKVLIEGSGDGISLGRSYRDAPEIDGMVIVQGELEPGTFAKVHIDGAMQHDLMGFPVV